MVFMVWDYFFISVDVQIQVSESVLGNKKILSEHLEGLSRLEKILFSNSW